MNITKQMATATLRNCNNVTNNKNQKQKHQQPL